MATAATLALHVGRSSLTANAAPSTDLEIVDPDNVMVLVRSKLESVDEDYDCDGHDDVEATCEVLSEKEECYNGSPVSVQLFLPPFHLDVVAMIQLF